MAKDEAESPVNFEAKLQALSELLGPDSQPNINVLWKIAKDIEAIKLNVKFFGYELSRELAAALPPAASVPPGFVGLACKPSTQRDMQSAWVAYWAKQLQTVVVFHRKIWELCYVLQALEENGALQPGARGLGFACGEEPLPSYLAARGIHVTITDLEPESAQQKGWLGTNQHASSLDKCHLPHLVGKDAFLRYASHEYVDMNAIPPHLRGFDFCWSVCSLEHLGSIERGLAFIENSLETLRPGGMAVHTTEYNFSNDEKTIDNWPTVLFQKKHFQEIAQRLLDKGHWVARLDFDIGSQPLDRFIDMPPYSHDMTGSMRQHWSADATHLKLMIDGFPSTCFGMIIRKAEA